LYSEFISLVTTHDEIADPGEALNSGSHQSLTTSTVSASA
jgi:hypothetical protein